MNDFDDDQCHKCLMKKGDHTEQCYYEMYIESGKEDYKDMFEEAKN